MDKVSLAYWPHLIGGYRGNRCCRAAQSEKLDFIGLPLTVNKYYGSDITCF